MYVNTRKYRGGIRTADKSTPDYVTFKDLDESNDRLNDSLTDKIDKVENRLDQKIVQLWEVVTDLQRDSRSRDRYIIALLAAILIAIVEDALGLPGLVGL